MSADTFADQFGEPSLPGHVYIHVPFCGSKCSYCDFASVAGASDELVRGVFTGIRAEIRRWAACGLTGVVDTLYFGGGTPSRYPEEVVRVLDFAREHLVIRGDAEITVEANPDSLDRDVAASLGSAGVTRISVGVQSFDEHVLRVLGRRHDVHAAVGACAAVIDAGLDLSVDLICGVPGQTLSSWSESVARAAATGARHLSVYPLSVEEGTPLEVAIATGLLPEVDADEAAEMMLVAEASLEQLGYHRYEVANYATDRDHESRHNSAYWSGRTYLGIGPAAHGMLDGDAARAVGLVPFGDETTARVRYGNARDIEGWMVGRDPEIENLTAPEVLREDVMLGMRLFRGVPAGQVSAAGLDGVFEGLARDGLAEKVDAGAGAASPRWRTTRRGWLLGNEVFGRIWLDET